MQKAKCHTWNKDLSNIFATHFVMINSTVVALSAYTYRVPHLCIYRGIWPIHFGLFHLAQNLLGFEDFL